MDTLLLDNAAWDLVLDSFGNIAMASAPYAVAQDVASAIRTFEGEVWYDTTLGVPYFQQILDQSVSPSRVATALNAAASVVPTVQNASTTIISIDGRKLSGQLTFSTSDNNTVSVNF